MRQHDTEHAGLSIFHRLLLGFIGISLFIISIMGSVYYFYAKERVNEFEKKEIEHVLDGALSYFDNTYKNTITSDLALLESAPSLDNFLTVPKNEIPLVRFDLEKMFFRLAKAQDLYRIILFIDEYGQEKIIIKDRKRIRRYSSIYQYKQQDSPINHGMALLFNRLKASPPGNILFEGPFKDTDNKQIFVVGISKREPEIAGFGGVIMFHCDLTDFISYLAKIKVFDTPVAWLYTDKGNILLSPPDHERLIDPFPHIEKENYSGTKEIISHDHNLFIHGKGCTLGTDNQNIFHIAFSLPPDIFAKLMKEVLLRTLMIIALVLGVAGLISYILARQFAKPIIELSRASQLLSKGELTVAPLVKGGGEIGVLSRSFHYMAKDLQKLIKNRDQEISSRKQAEELLQKAHDELEQHVEERTLELRKTHKQLLHAEKLSAIGQLSASIAHEFNNPLQGILNIIKGVAKRATLDEDDEKLMTMAVGECNRMRDLIKSLMDFNRPTSGRKAPTDIHAILDSLLVLGKKEYSIREITIEKRYAENMPLIKTVADQIKQVFLNLLNNATDACAEGGTITVETEALKKKVVVRIHDTGTGIKPEDKDHIFEPFFTTKQSIKGTGLGLSISYGIIKKHGGEIIVDSVQGKGTTFSVILLIEGGDNAKKNSSAG